MSTDDYMGGVSEKKLIKILTCCAFLLKSKKKSIPAEDPDNLETYTQWVLDFRTMYRNVIGPEM